MNTRKSWNHYGAWRNRIKNEPRDNVFERVLLPLSAALPEHAELDAGFAEYSSEQSEGPTAHLPVKLLPTRTKLTPLCISYNKEAFWYCVLSPMRISWEENMRVFEAMETCRRSGGMRAWDALNYQQQHGLCFGYQIPGDEALGVTEITSVEALSRENWFGFLVRALNLRIQKLVGDAKWYKI
ncbi:hypothetical protein HDU76_008294, partial [Blyttiomyces sp. JEL0837]